MHYSLRPGPGVAVILVCMTFAAATILFTRPFAWAVWLLATTFAVAAGIAQRRSLESVPDEFRNASTMPEVRSALMSTRAGKLSITLLWSFVPLLLVASFLSRNLFGALGAYAGFVAIRDLVALKSVAALGTEASGDA